jgi:hypothetical protein
LPDLGGTLAYLGSHPKKKQTEEEERRFTCSSDQVPKIEILQRREEEMREAEKRRRS